MADPTTDYGGSGQNKRLSHPHRKPDWARLSPSPFLNRRWIRRNWVKEFDLWTVERLHETVVSDDKPSPTEPDDQLTIRFALLDAIWFEFIRRTPLSVETIAEDAALAKHRPAASDLRRNLSDQ